MQIAWSEKDIECGRFVHTIPLDANLNLMDPGSKAGRLYVISFGYDKSGGGHDQVYYLTSLADGMQVYHSKTTEELAQHLTERNFHPMSGADKDVVINKAADVALRTR
jgi:hypothetical protein